MWAEGTVLGVAHLPVGLHPLARLQELGHRLARRVLLLLLLLLLLPRLLIDDRHVPHLRGGHVRIAHTQGPAEPPTAPPHPRVCV